MGKRLLLCNINTFTIPQRIELISENGINELGAAPLPDLGNVLVAYCEQMDVNHIHLIGNDKFIQEGIVPQIKQRSYGIRDIEIEVN